ncbi:DUF1906 domain-containing protein [Actinomadura welshii]
MRHAVLFSTVVCGVAVTAPVLAALGAAPARPAPDRAAAPVHDTAPAGDAARLSAARTVEYRGLRIPVPAGWEVHDLERDPARCVRYDRRALYLGRPGPQPDCPARIVGRTEAVHVQPAGPRQAGAPEPSASRTIVPGEKLAALEVPETVDHEMRLELPEAGVTITGVYGTDPAPLQRMLRGARLTGERPAELRTPEPSARREAPDPPAAGPSTASPSTASPSMASPSATSSSSASTPATGPSAETPPSPSPSAASPSAAGPSAAAPSAASPDGAGAAAGERDKRWVKGKGFDTCTAPSLAAMKAWRPSFKVTNIYIGGAARGCAQPNLTERWVREVRGMGYRITPTYVGLQAPCGPRPQKFTAKNAAKQGRKAAVDAARRAKALGIPKGAPIYFDMEAYGGKRKCRNAVLRFVDNWVRKLKDEGYTPCLYSSVKSGIRDVGRAAGISKPEGIWFAHWNGKADVYGDPFIPDGWWRPHRRIKQYRGDHNETHGGVTLNIDSNIADGLAY